MELRYITIRKRNDRRSSLCLQVEIFDALQTRLLPNVLFNFLDPISKSYPLE